MDTGFTFPSTIFDIIPNIHSIMTLFIDWIIEKIIPLESRIENHWSNLQFLILVVCQFTIFPLMSWVVYEYKAEKALPQSNKGLLFELLSAIVAFDIWSSFAARSTGPWRHCGEKNCSCLQKSGGLAHFAAASCFLGTCCIIRAAAGEQEVNQLQSFLYYERNQSRNLTSWMPVRNKCLLIFFPPIFLFHLFEIGFFYYYFFFLWKKMGKRFYFPAKSFNVWIIVSSLFQQRAAKFSYAVLL